VKVVLDTSVIVAALRSNRGASNRVLQLAYTRTFQALATPALFLEYEEVLGRDEHRDVHRMSQETLGNFLVGLAAIIEPVRVYYQWRPQLQDTDDEMVLESALNGRADVIVTHNVKDFVLATTRFQVRVLTPANFVSEMLK
jgi:putative PIN family toxin of toxin-antitoxin system